MGGHIHQDGFNFFLLTKKIMLQYIFFSRKSDNSNVFNASTEICIKIKNRIINI